MKNNKQSLYNKYRPSNFEQVIGQKVVKDILMNSILKNKINHAYLFFGIRGTGKTTLARIFSKAINCPFPIGVEPCNACDICNSISNGSAFDVIEIDAASNNGVDEIRSLKENASYLTTTSKYKVYIIDEVHMLTKAAFNALLKTLEEPPMNTVFLLATTEIKKIPQTVLSRTVILNLEVMSNKDITTGLEVILKGEDKEYDKESLEYITMVSGGSLRDAISFVETSLLFNDILSVENVIKSLGLVEKTHLMKLLAEDPQELANEIDTADKDPNKIALLMMDVILIFIKEGKTEYVELLNRVLSAANTIKDPSLMKIALKSALYSIPLKTKVEYVSRETYQEAQEKEDQTPSPSPVFEEKEIDQEITNNEENPNEKKEITGGLNIITDYINANNYVFIIKTNIAKLLETEKYRWSFLSNYITSKEFKDIIPILINTTLLASTEKTTILGFTKEQQINEFKRVSLKPELFKFIKEILGTPKFILPINEETWTKLLSVKENITLGDDYYDIPLEMDDFLENPQNKKIKDLGLLFGKDKVINE